MDQTNRHLTQRRFLSRRRPHAAGRGDGMPLPMIEIQHLKNTATRSAENLEDIPWESFGLIVPTPKHAHACLPLLEPTYGDVDRRSTSQEPLASAYRLHVRLLCPTKTCSPGSTSTTRAVMASPGMPRTPDRLSQAASLTRRDAEIRRRGMCQRLCFAKICCTPRSY